MKKVNLDIVCEPKNLRCKILFRGSMSESFKKIPSISDEYEYSNIKKNDS